jgi:hypothetical protein
LGLLEAQVEAPVRPISYYFKFDEQVSPLPLVFDKTQSLGEMQYSLLSNNVRISGDELIQLWNKFDGLKAETKTRLEPALRWISRSLREPEVVDAMIAVGIALESLFHPKLLNGARLHFA